MNDWTDTGSYAYNKLQSENEDLKRLVESQCYDLDAMSAIKEERDECYVLLRQALEALTAISGDVCNYVHHAKKDRHPYGEVCPVHVRHEATIAALRERLA
jgi:hypothetical protein